MQSKLKIFWSTNILALLGWMSINIYLPSLPTLTDYFHTSPANLKLSISLFLTGFALSQFFWGSLSERFGRKKALLVGLIFADIGTIMAMLAPDIILFNSARFIEGIGIGSASVLARAVLTDSFERRELSKAFSAISTTANILPALAPILGGYILLFLSWRFIFLFLVLYTSSLMLFFYKSVEETHPCIHPDFTLKEALQQYLQVLTHRQFWGYLLPYALLSGGMLSYYSATPFIFITHLHIAAQHYSYYSIATVATYIIGANLARLLSTKGNFNQAIYIGIALALVASLILIINGFLFSLTPLTVVIPIMLYTTAAGIVAPNANACAMTSIPALAGASSAVASAALYLFSAILSSILTSLNLGSLLPLAFFISILSLLSLWALKGLLRPKNKLPSRPSN